MTTRRDRAITRIALTTGLAMLIVGCAPEAAAPTPSTVAIAPSPSPAATTATAAPTPSAPPNLGTAGRILVSLEGSGSRLFRDGVEEPVRLAAGGRCPGLIATAEATAVRHRWAGTEFRGHDNRTSSQTFKHANMEFLSPDHSAYAVVSFETGVTVYTFPDGDFVNPMIEEYSISGVKDPFFSADGSRLAVTVAAGPGSDAIHVLGDGTDTIIATVPTAGEQYPRGSWSPDAAKLVIATTDAGTANRLALVGMDGSVSDLGRPDGLAPDAWLAPLAWSTNGKNLVVGSGSGTAWVLDVGRVEWQPLPTRIEAWDPAALRWSPDGRLAIVNDGWLTVHSFDGTRERPVGLPGSTTVWSPDGRSIASIGESIDGERVLWVTDVWGTGESRQIAELPPVDRSDPRPPDYQDSACMDWQPEVG